MKARVKWIEGMCMLGESDSGHGIIMDAAPQTGGRNLGTRPMEMILMGLGGCSTVDVMLILRKSHQNVTNCVVDIQAERRETEPKVFTDIQLHYTITGIDLKESHIKRAIDLSAEKYCSVSAMLEKTAKITYDYEIIQATTA